MLATLLLGAVLQAQPTSVPYKDVRGLIMAPVTIKGEELMFIWDTGAETSVIDSDAARRLGIKPVEEVTAVGVSGREETHIAEPVMMEGLGPSVQVSPVLLNLVGVSNMLRFPVAGIIGCDVMKDRVVDLDPGAKTLTWHAPGMQPDVTGCAEFPAVLKDGRPAVKLQLTQGSTIDVVAVLDTGNNRTLTVRQHWFDRSGLTEGEFGRSNLSVGVGGAQANRQMRTEKLSLGSISMENFFMTISPNQERMYGEPLLGMQFFRGRRLVVDIPGKRVFVGAAPGEASNPLSKT